MSSETSAKKFLEDSIYDKYSYNFSWLSRPIIQYPQDIVAVQELVADVQPDLIIETGIAHGGSLILSASLLCLIDVMNGDDPRTSPSKVLGIDVDIRPKNRIAIEEHPLSFKIKMIEDSSIDQSTIAKVHEFSTSFSKIMVFLDSNHTHEHVISELNAYANLVSKDSYCIVFDTIIESLPEETYHDRPWCVGNNPKSAIDEWLPNHPDFIADTSVDNKLLVSVAPGGYLKRV